MTTFTRARWAIGVSGLLTIAAMLCYPGGTARDPASEGYSLVRNFLSDLGMTVAYDGRSNRLGAALFVAGLVIVVAGLGGALIGFVRLYARVPLARRLTRVAGVVGALVCAGFVGVALTPENRVMALHVQFTLFAFRAVPAVALLFTLASRADTTLPPRVTLAWAVLTLVLVGYVIELGWGPDVTTARGLPVQVVAQKTVVILGMLLLGYQTYEADRAIAHTASAK